MLLLLVLGMLEVLVVLVVLKELVVFVRGKFERVKSPNFFWGKIIESKKKSFGAQKNKKILKTESKIHLYFRVVHSIIPLVIPDFFATCYTLGVVEKSEITISPEI